ncbi:MAG: biotin--[acetyl-CoA-carboxylase] ligase [Fulvimarina manganoxydans]|uniref:biotin--[acetyl-CoA-carboxylase] ligase n=1 Tax=Fulvimarina manganoxydans TaxID=937218 RepID=UPI002357603D|nr:biotin--[acetyl-CoA-carboxylase] ligase [Fulvimarina manganoxydans]MCK5932324.1 biotin--[acetyl-CoA-carboxylase] ligase [Fulvimarina manganoxydans]
MPVPPLSKHRASAGHRRRLAFEDVTSTNTLAREAARSGDPGGLWITAARQNEGRGRRGRAWVSEAGNLYASLLLIDPAPPQHLAKLPFVVALAVREALASLLGDERQVKVKWPNDVLVGGRKCVGILLESERLANGSTSVVIGCGINVAEPPSGLPYQATALSLEGFRGDLESVFEALASAMDRELGLFHRGAGFHHARERWLSHAVGVGAACTVRLTNQTIEGTFEALDAEGRLLLALANGERMPISAGDVFFSGAP